MSRKNRWWRYAVGLLVTCLFLYLAFGRLEWDTFRGVIIGAIPGPVILGIGLLAADFFIRIVRWWWMLKTLEPELPLGNCGWPFLVSIAINNILPFRVGDLIRVVGFRENLRVPVAQLFGILFIERLLDLLVLLGFFFLGLLFMHTGALPSTFVTMSIWVACAGLAVFLALLLIPRQVRAALTWILRRPSLEMRGWSGKLASLMEEFFVALALLRKPRLFIELMALSVLAWTLEGGVFATAAWSLQTNTALLGSFFALATGTLATLLPSSPGYIGTFDYFTMLGLMAYDAHRESAAAFAILVHGILWAPLTLVGSSYFLIPSGRLLWRKAHLQPSDTKTYE